MALPAALDRARRIFRRIHYFDRLYPLSRILGDALLMPFDYFARRDGRVSRLNNLTLVLTNRCPAHCDVCFFNETLNRQEEELTTAELVRLFDEVAADRPAIIFTGGEPLVRDDIGELVRETGRRRLPRMIFTNGILLDRFAETLIESEIEYIGVSIFGPQEVHDAATGLKCFDRVTANLRDFNRRKRSTRTIINYTLTEENVTRLEFPLELARDLGCDGVRFQHLGFLTPEEKGEIPLSGPFARHSVHVCPVPVGITPERLASLKVPAGIAVQFAPDLTPGEIASWYSNRPAPPPRQCLYLWRGAHVHSNGEVYPCYKINYSFGNVRERPLMEIVNGERARAFRLEFRKKGLPGICRRCCKL